MVASSRGKSIVALVGYVLDRIVVANDMTDSAVNLQSPNVVGSESEKGNHGEGEGASIGVEENGRGMEMFEVEKKFEKVLSQYVIRIVKYSNCSPSCLIVALVYLRRLGLVQFSAAGRGQVHPRLTSYNSQKLLLIAVSLSPESLLVCAYVCVCVRVCVCVCVEIVAPHVVDPRRLAQENSQK